MVLRRKLSAFYRIFLGHEHGKRICKTDFCTRKGVVVGVKVRHYLQTGLFQRVDEALRVADTGDDMRALPSQGCQWLFLMGQQVDQGIALHLHVFTIGNDEIAGLQA